MRRLLLLSFLLLLALPAAASAQADRTWVSRNGGGSTLSSLTNGFIVNMSLNNTDTVRRVVLRNLSINGTGAGTNGVRVLDANAVHLEDVLIENVTTHGVDIAPAGGACIGPEGQGRFAARRGGEGRAHRRAAVTSPAGAGRWRRSEL